MSSSMILCMMAHQLKGLDFTASSREKDVDYHYSRDYFCNHCQYAYLLCWQQYSSEITEELFLLF